MKRSLLAAALQAAAIFSGAVELNRARDASGCVPEVGSVKPAKTRAPNVGRGTKRHQRAAIKARNVRRNRRAHRA